MYALMELVILVLALVGGYAMAGWVGIVVVAVFVVTMVASIVARLRSPRVRLLRDISRALPDGVELVGIVHQPGCKHHAHPMATPPSDTTEG